MKLNEIQTPLDDTLLKELSKELKEEIFDVIDTIEFVKRLISPNRPRIADLPKDEEGKIEVDISNPHILEDMDYFRQAAIHFQQYKTFTRIHPNTHPNSSYARFWKEEARRCRDGLVREDGEWIPGSYYFYLNYSPILLTSKINKSGKSGTKILDFPHVYDGDYLYYHYKDQARKEGEHVAMLKRRGVGFSYKSGSDLARAFILGESSINTNNVTCFAIANEKEYLTKDGILNKFVHHVNWCAEHTPWSRLKLKDSYNEMQWVMGYKNREGLVKGTQNSVIGVTTQGDPDKARGKRGPLVYWEEFGKNPYLLQSWEIARHSVEDGDISVGQLIGGGTGGTESADFKGAETLFYSPGGYHVRAIPNIYDKNAIGQTKCAFFFPAYLNRTGCYDKNGNSDVVAALLRILEERIKIKYGSTDTNALVQHKAEMCITPQDAVMRREGNIFPVVDLKDMVAEAVVDINKFTASHYVGTLKNKADGQIDWDMQQNHPVLREFPIKDDIDRTGCVEIFELPKRDSEGRVPFGRYIAGVDPIDSDEGTYTVSLGSCFIFDLWTDRIVAEYSGRPPRATDFYDTALRLIRYYNAQANYENNIKGFFAYAENMNLLQYLSDTPQILRDMDLIKGAGFGNTAHPYSEYIYTPSGKKQWKDIKIGDIIFADNGQSTKVVDIPFDDFTDIYKITLFDGRIVYASNNHLWDVLKPSTKQRSTLSTKELFYKYKRLHKSGYSTHEYLIPSSSKVEFNKQDVPIDPYTLGLLLGDGSVKSTKGNTVRFTSNYCDLTEYNKFIPNIYKFTTPSDDRHCYIRIPNAESYLKKLNLNNKTSINKFIPNIYKFNTSEIRLNILKGLLDTDGYVGQGTPVFNTISKQLAEDVCFIARSLGYHSKIYLNKAGYKKGDIYIQCNDSYAIKIWTNENLFKLPRKLKKLSKNPSGKLKARMLGIPIIDIKYSHREKAKCITVNNKSECYLINDFIVTHNSKGTTASKFVNAWGRKLQADWMISSAYTLEEDEYDEEGNKIEKPQLLNLHTIRSLGYLREAIAWDPDGNFDRVSAMGMCMVLREDRIKYINRNVEDKINDRFKDNFFNRLGGFNYRSKFKKKFDFRYSRGEKDYEKLI
jgi:hypothetical protein